VVAVIPKEQIPPILRPERVQPVALASIAERFNLETPSDFQNLTVTGISMNTGDLRSGDLFVAMPGKKTHGALFIAKALELGASAIVTDAAGLALAG
jgi:UDP-N-acetylmuramoyl-L-alanyl-D-glutamate--2,6-diaminopimelate ligase